jgi:hypothetical protein
VADHVSKLLCAVIDFGEMGDVALVIGLGSKRCKEWQALIV